jgi:anti-sigma factor RsiW
MTSLLRPSARCRRLLVELSRYLDGDLTPARRRTVERHIAGCACCATMTARLRRTVAACRAEGNRRPSRQVALRAAARIRALIATDERRRSGG